MINITIINGPNLNLLGSREVSLYGHSTLLDLEKQWHHRATSYGFTLSTLQSNHEGQLIDYIHQQSLTSKAIIINGAGYSHSSIALADSLKATSVIKVELHISNIFSRETMRHHSYLAAVCDATLCGMGPFGYLAAIDYVQHRLANP